MKAARAKCEKVLGIQAALEGYRRFDYDYIPFGKWRMPDGNYRYRRRGFDRACVGFWRTVLFFFSRPLITVLYGVRTTGRKNLKTIKKTGAVSICNHFHFLDTLFVRHAVGQYRSFHTMGPKNNKTGFGGWVVRHGGMLPFSADLNAARHLNAEIGRLLECGKIVNFYPEQALWFNFQKPRPMKDGAFHYAVKHGVPVLPIFCTFQKSARGRMRKLRIHILPAICADQTLPRRERLDKMKTEAEAAWRNCYERVYGMPLTYLPDRRR